MSTLTNRRVPSPPIDVADGVAVEHSLDMQKYVIPNFTIKDLLDCIPSHCFQRSALRSSLYIVWDLFLLGVLTMAINWVDSSIASTLGFAAPLRGLAKFAAWSVYWFAAGLVTTGLWVIAHECGHQAFSESKTLNNAVGFVLHSALGVPFHSWRITHAKHHAATGHMTRDQVFVPPTRSNLSLPAFDETKEDKQGRWVTEGIRKEFAEALDESPLVQVLTLVFQQVFGWPAYLLRNTSGQRTYPSGTNHFDPNSVIFDRRHYYQIIQSDIGMVLWLGGLALWGYTRGFAEVALYYLPIYLWVNHWLVLITFLQHTDPLLPHYRGGVWSFPRGALCTMDRTLLGPIGGWVLHGIAETHVAHHVNYKIPHYHAWEATAALKERLGPAYMQSDENIILALWRVWRECKFVEDDGDVVFYKNKEGKAHSVAVFQDKEGGFSDSGVDVQ